jgi:hypothetical protein
MFYLIDHGVLHHSLSWMFMENVVTAWNNKLIALIELQLVANGSSMPSFSGGVSVHGDILTITCSSWGGKVIVA